MPIIDKQTNYTLLLYTLLLYGPKLPWAEIV